ncbi:MAG: hpt2 [Planctomycetaceae bacterium]|nr:hpt2 [Planctomycetaceae bacterium]
MNYQLRTWPRIANAPGATQDHSRRPKTLIPKKEVKTQVQALATNLSEHLKYQVGSEDLVVISVMSGGVYFAVDIDRLLGEGRLGLRTAMHYIHLHRVPGAPPQEHMRTFQESDIQSRHVVLIDDIVDTGSTLRYAVDVVQGFGPKSLETVSLLWKPKQTVGNFRPNWCCFQINDVFVCGYGMDDQDGRYRNLQSIVCWPDRDKRGEYTPLKPYRLD